MMTTNAVRVAAQLLLQPGDGRNIEMVGGLVEQHQFPAASAQARAKAARRRSPPEATPPAGRGKAQALGRGSHAPGLIAGRPAAA